MAGRCVNGHEGPLNRHDCMYCGAPMMARPQPAVPPPAPMGTAHQGPSGWSGGEPVTRGPVSEAAVGSLVLALAWPVVASLTSVLIAGVVSLVAIGLALYALGEIRAFHKRGAAVAWAGAVLGVFGLIGVAAVFIAGGIVDTSDTSGDGSTPNEQGGTADCVTAQRTIRTANEAYFAKNGSYARSTEELVQDGMMLQESALYELVYVDETTAPKLRALPGECEGVSTGS